MGSIVRLRRFLTLYRYRGLMHQLNVRKTKGRKAKYKQLFLLAECVPTTYRR